MVSFLTTAQVVAPELNAADATVECLKQKYDAVGSAQESQKFYYMFNKTRALRKAVEKFLAEAEILFGKPSAKSLCPNVPEAIIDCKKQLGQTESQDARRAIANLTALTSLFRTLQPGETRNVLSNKVLKGFICESLKPSVGLLEALAKHATPQLYQEFISFYGKVPTANSSA